MDVRTALNALLAAPQLDEIEQRLRRRSALHILNIDRNELSHAALLAWLLDPRASHGMGSTPLRGFLIASARRAVHAGMVDAADVDGLDLDALLVEKEVSVKVPGLENDKRIDVLASLPASSAEEDRGPPILAVEYKVDAQEGLNQTAFYATWAAEHAFELRGRRVMPLQVFVCPDRGKDEFPSPPFVFLDYDEYVKWLGSLAVLDKTQQAAFLIDEFRACLTQRRDVAARETNQRLAALEAAEQEAVDSLRRASTDELDEFSAVLARHEEVFSRLGIIRRARSKGDPPFVAAVRAALAAHLDATRWRLLGRGSLEAIFLPALEATQRAAASRGQSRKSSLRVHLYMDRPKNERARLAFEVMGDLPGVDKSMQRALRRRIAASLRDRLPHDLGADRGSGNIVCNFPFVAPGIAGVDDDVAARLDAVCLSAIRAGAAVAAKIEGVLGSWVEDTLPGLLATAS